jgi:hypothetical protein
MTNYIEISWLPRDSHCIAYSDVTVCVPCGIESATETCSVFIGGRCGSICLISNSQ